MAHPQPRPDATGEFVSFMLAERRRNRTVFWPVAIPTLDEASRTEALRSLAPGAMVVATGTVSCSTYLWLKGYLGVGMMAQTILSSGPTEPIIGTCYSYGHYFGEAEPDRRETLPTPEGL